jgi:hypothetical protein
VSLHPVTQLMLLATLLILGADAGWMLATARTLWGGVLPSDARLVDQVAFWGWMGAPPLHILAYALQALGGAFIIEILSRILADLKRRNLALAEQ